jgi:hypothetical protein
MTTKICMATRIWSNPNIFDFVDLAAIKEDPPRRHGAEKNLKPPMHTDSHRSIHHSTKSLDDPSVSCFIWMDRCESVCMDGSKFFSFSSPCLHVSVVNFFGCGRRRAERFRAFAANLILIVATATPKVAGGGHSILTTLLRLARDPPA